MTEPDPKRSAPWTPQRFYRVGFNDGAAAAFNDISAAMDEFSAHETEACQDGWSDLCGDHPEVLKLAAAEDDEASENVEDGEASEKDANYLSKGNKFLFNITASGTDNRFPGHIVIDYNGLAVTIGNVSIVLDAADTVLRVFVGREDEDEQQRVWTAALL